MDDSELEALADKGIVVDTWEEVGEGIAIRTTTLIIGCGGGLESDIAEIEWELVPLLIRVDDEAGTEELRCKNILARVSKEDGMVGTSAVLWFSSSSPLGGAEGFINVVTGMEGG